MYGAIAAALLGAVIIGVARARGREREDTVISALWAVGMAVGILFLFRTPGYKADLMTYLFGNIVMVDAASLKLLVVLDVVILAVTLTFYRPLLAVCFDEEFARLRGINVGVFYTLLLMLDRADDRDADLRRRHRAGHRAGDPAGLGRRAVRRSASGG